VGSKILEIFTTREIATIIWIVILFFVFISIKKKRNAILRILKHGNSKKIVIFFLVLFAYSAVFIALFSMSHLCRIEYVKVILLWTLFAGVPLCFNAVTKGLEDGYFKKMLFDCFKLTVLVEYITTLFTFSLITEMIILPVIAIIFLMFIVSESKDEYKQVNKFFFIILSIALILFFAFTFQVAIETYPSLDPMDIVVGFFIPVVFSILYIPLIYLLVVYSKYELIFIRMKNYGEIGEYIRKNKKLKVFKACGLSNNKLCKFQVDCNREMTLNMKEDEFDRFIEDFIEKNN